MDVDKSGDVSKEEALKYIKGYELGQSLKRMMSGTDMWDMAFHSKNDEFAHFAEITVFY